MGSEMCIRDSTYIKEIIDGNSIITLAEEEQEALKMAKESTGSNPAK